MVDQPFERGLVPARDDDRLAVPCAYFLDVRDDLVEDRVVRCDEDHRHRLVDQGDRPMLHLRRRVALGVDVADLLELERPLERGREVVAATEVEEILRVLVRLGDLLDLRRTIENALDLLGELGERLCDLAPAHHRERALASELEREERERNDLAREGLGRRDADLGPRVQIDAAVVLARDRRSHDVDQPERAGTTALGLAHGGERVGGLARLRDEDAERARRDDRVAVAELRRVLDLGRDASEVLDHHLADQRRVPAGAAGGDDDVVDVHELLVAQVDAAELGGPVLEDEAAAHGVLHRLRLLEDLLEHEMVEPTALDRREVPLDALHRAAERRRVDVHHAVAVGREHAEVTVVQVDDLARVREDRRGVGGEEVLAVADADEERTALARGDDLLRVTARHHRDAERALDLAQCRDDRLLQRALVELLDQVRDRLGVGIGAEGVPERGELLPEHIGVLDDAVVHHRDRLVGAEVRVCVALGRRAVSGPARVCDPDLSGHRISGERALELRDLAGGAARLERLAVEHGDARRVIAAVLEALEARDEDRGGLLGTDVADNTAHGTGGWCEV